MKQIPQELRDLRQWHCWQDVNGTKIPYQSDGQTAKSNDASTWTDFESACVAADRFSGLAFEITEPYCGVDLDNCLTEKGKLKPWALEIVARFSGVAYMEFSPSGTGIKLITRARKPNGARCVHKFGGEKEQVECYDNRRFWAMTGKVYASEGQISDGQTVVDWLAEKYLMLKRDDKTDNTPQERVSSVLSSNFEGEKSVCINGAGTDLMTRAQSYTEAVSPAMEGDRNNTAFSLSGHLYSIEGDDGQRLNREQVLDLVRGWNSDNTPPLPDEEVQRVVMSAGRNGVPREDKPSKRDDKTPRELVSSVLSSDSEDWPEPAAITASEPAEMTPDDFPDFIGDIVRAVAENSETPVELPGLLTLGILATGCQQRYEIASDGDHTEPLSLWCCPALESGNRKTAVLNGLAKPVRSFERSERAKTEQKRRQSESKRRTLERRVDNLRTKAARARDNQQMNDFQREIDAIERDLPPVEFPPTLVADDCTPEHIATLLSHHDERLTVLSDEAGVFELMAGRYSRGVSNLDVYLQSHAGSPVRVDRGSRPSVDLEKPCLSIVVSPQPSVLEDFGQRKEFVGRGLLARFLFAVPKSRLGYRSLRPKPIPLNVSERWDQTVQRMLAMDQPKNGFGKPQPQTLYLSKEAYSLWKSEQKASECDMRPGRPWAQQKAWASKYPGAVLRIAGVLHVALCVDQQRDPAKEEVPGDTMAAAVRLGQKIKAHSLKTFDVMALNEDQRFARKVLEWIKRENLQRFTARQAAIHCNSAGSSKELEGAFLLLAERGWIRRGPKQQPKGGGRPSQPWDVHPEIAKFTDKTDTTPRESVSSVMSSDFEDARAKRPEPESGNVAIADWIDEAF